MYGRTKKGCHGDVDGIRPIPVWLVGVACTLAPRVPCTRLLFSGYPSAAGRWRGRKDEDTGEGVGERERGSEREDEVEVGRKSRRDYPVATGAYKRIMLGRAGAEMPACKRNQFAIRYDPGNSGLA